MTAYPDRSIPGLEIITPDPPQPWALVVRAEKRQTEWRVFSDRLEDKLDPQCTPTGIIYWNEIYRIEREIQTTDGWMYCMRPWPEHENIFHRFELSNAYIEGRKEETRELKSQITKTEVSAFYDFLVGFLPARAQHELSQTLGFDPVEATRHSGIFGFHLGVFVLFFGWIKGMPFFASLLLGGMLGLDGLIRWAWVITDDRVNGLLIGELLDRLPGWAARTFGSKTPPSPDSRD